MLADEWKTLDDNKKQRFYQEAEHLKNLHQIQFPDYKYSPRARKGTARKRGASTDSGLASTAAANSAYRAAAPTLKRIAPMPMPQMQQQQIQQQQLIRIPQVPQQMAVMSLQQPRPMIPLEQLQQRALQQQQQQQQQQLMALAAEQELSAAAAEASRAAMAQQQVQQQQQRPRTNADGVIEINLE